MCHFQEPLAHAHLLNKKERTVCNAIMSSVPGTVPPCNSTISSVPGRLPCSCHFASSLRALFLPFCQFVTCLVPAILPLRYVPCSCQFASSLRALFLPVRYVPCSCQFASSLPALFLPFCQFVTCLVACPVFDHITNARKPSLEAPLLYCPCSSPAFSSDVLIQHQECPPYQ